MRTTGLPTSRSGYLYIRDADTRQYFRLNEPERGTPWQSVQGLGYTQIAATDLELEITGTYFVPRDEDVLILAD